MNPDAVAEVPVLTSNFQAEYGKAGGSVVQYTTRGIGGEAADGGGDGLGVENGGQQGTAKDASSH
jgi:hypothetical protein